MSGNIRCYVISVGTTYRITKYFFKAQTLNVGYCRLTPEKAKTELYSVSNIYCLFKQELYRIEFLKFADE